jgi:hypothetical protein
MKSGLFLLLFGSSVLCLKAATYVDPVTDGWVTSTYTDTSDYVEVGANGGEGALVFSTASVEAAGSVFDLEINPYGEPMWVWPDPEKLDMTKM